MKTRYTLLNLGLALVAFVLLIGTVSAGAEVLVTVGDVTVSPGDTGFTVDVTVNDQSAAIRGAEINIGYDSGVLTFDSGTAVDGDWFVDQVTSVAADDSNTQSGQLKILLAATGTGIDAGTAATLAQLTFDIAGSASELSYPLTYLSSSPGLKDTSSQTITATGVSGSVFVTGIATGTVTLTPAAASVTADDTATSTITSSAIVDAAGANVPDNTLVTVSTTLGTITTTDADTGTDGIQVATSAGVVTITLQAGLTIGTATVTASSVAGDAAGSTTVDFTAVPATALSVTTITDPVTAGVASDVMVKAIGDGGLTATEYTGTVSFTSSDTSAVLPESYTFLTGDSGVKTVTGGVTLKTAGEQTVTATDTTTASITGVQSGIDVNAAAAAKMTLTTTKSTLASDTKGTATLTATVLDEFGNVVITDSTTEINFALSDETYLALASATATASSGVATVEVNSTAGTVTSPPATSNASITSGDLTAPAAVALTIVNFSIDVADSRTDLVRSPLAPSSVVLTGTGGTSGNYRWTIAGVGSFSDSETVTASEADSVTLYAPSSLDGDSQTATVDLEDTDDPDGLNDQVVVTVYNPTKLAITSTALSLTAGVSGTATVEVQNASSAADTHGAFTVNLATDSTGTAKFYTAGTTTEITSVTIAEGASSATFDYNDQLKGTPTITASATGMADATQQATIAPDVPDRMTLEAGKTQLISDAKGSTTLTATLLDQYGNVVSTDSSTVVTFALSDDTYLSLSSTTTTASSGVASVTVSSKSGMVTSPPATSNASIASGDLTPPTAVSLTVINFTIDVADSRTDLVRSPLTPSSVVLTGLGGTSGKYRWTITGVGSFSDSETVTTSEADAVTLYAPSSMDGDSQTATVDLKDADDPDVNARVVVTVYNPTKLVITSTALSLTAGVSGTATVEVQNASSAADTHGALTVNLATDSTGTAKFYTAGTTTGITSVMIADGASSAVFDYNDQLKGTPTITASATGMAEATQQETITPDVPSKMTLEVDETQLISNEKGSTTLTATVLDQYGNLVTTDSTTVISFALTDGTYLALSSATATASAGVASVTVSSKPGMVTDPPATIGVSISSGDLTPPTAVSLTVINFTIGVTGTPTIQTSGSTPNSIALTGIGGTTGQFRWAITGGGSFSSEAAEGTSSEDAVTYYAPASVAGAYEDVTITLTDSVDTSAVSTTVIRVYAEVAVTSKPSAAPTVLSGATATYAVEGGDDTLYTWTVTDSAGTVIDTQTGASYTFTAPSTEGFAGMYTIAVADSNGFEDSFEVKVPIVITPDELAITETKYNGTANRQVFTVTGAASDYTWEMLEMDEDGNYQAVETPSDFGTWSNTSPVTDDNTNTFSPADVSEIKRFYVRVTVENDTDLTAENGLDQLVVGLFSVVPLAGYTVSVEDDSGAVSAQAITVTEEVTGQTKNLTASSGEVSFLLPDTYSTFSYIVEDTRTEAGYIRQQVSSKDTDVTVTLEQAGDDTIAGAVEDAGGGALADATVMAYNPEDLELNYEAMTDANGAYVIILPTGASSSGWTVVVTLAGYVSSEQENQAIADGVDFVLQARTAITSVTATVVDSTVQLAITANPAFTAATEASVSVTTGSGSLGALSLDDGTISVVYDAVTDFTVVIKADTSEDSDPTVGYAASRAFSYVADDTATEVAQDEVDDGGGTVELKVTDDPEAADQEAVVAVPAGGVTEDATIVIKTLPKVEESTATEASPDFVYEVTATNSSTGDELTDDEIVRIEIMLPIDLSVIEPGDLEDEVYVIYYADDLETLEAGGGTEVPVEQIISTDYVGDGAVGSVTFWLDHLSVLAIGLGVDDDLTLVDRSNDSSTSCFIHTTAQGSETGKTTAGAIPALVLILMALVVAVGRRFRKAMAGLTVAFACLLLVASPADAAGGALTDRQIGEIVRDAMASGKAKTVSVDAGCRFYAEFNAVRVLENIDAGQTAAKFSGPIAVDFDETWGFQLAAGYIYSDLLSAEALFEYVAPSEATLGTDGDDESELDVLNGSLNAKVTCPAWEKTKPYVVAGIGLMKTYEDIDYNGVSSKTNDWGVSFRVGAGVDLYATDRISIGLEGSYATGTGEADHVKYTTLSLGLAYHF